MGGYLARAFLATVSRPPCLGGPWGLGSLGVQGTASQKCASGTASRTQWVGWPKAHGPLLGGDTLCERQQQGEYSPLFP